MLLLDTGIPGNSREIFSDDADSKTRTRNLSVINRVLHILNYIAQKLITWKELKLSSWCIASLYIYHFSLVVEVSSKKNSASTGHRKSGTSGKIYSEDADVQTRTRNRLL